MKYYIKRDLNEYGPYTLADLQRYVASGNILLTDLARSEGLTDWVPVSQVLGNIPPPVAPAPAPGTVYPGGAAQPGTMYAGGAGQPAMSYTTVPGQVVPGPMPPDLHWALVLVIGWFCSIFSFVWLFIEAGFVKKIRPQNSSMGFLIAGVCCFFGSVVVVMMVAPMMAEQNEPNPAPLLLFLVAFLVGWALWLVGIFKMRDAIQEYYNTVEPINLRLSGVMTFFFAIYYFQYHFSRIAQWKKTGVLVPQG